MLRLPRKTTRRPFASPVARLPPTSMRVLEVLHLPRKTNLKCSKCCACHAKRAGGAASGAPATQNEAAPKVITCHRISAHLYEGAPSAAPATQKELEVLQVLRLPRKRRRRPKSSLVAGLPRTSMKVFQVLHLPPKTSLRCSKCCACHAKRAGGAPSGAPATQNEAAPKVITHRQTSADLYEGAPCCACHAKRA